MQINTPDVDPASGLIELPANLINADNLIVQNLCQLEAGKIARGSSFVITGKGGLPPNPSEPLSNLSGTVSWLNYQQLPIISEGENSNPTSDDTSGQPHVIRQAQGWGITPDGTIILTAEAVTVTPQNSQFIPPNCH